MKRLTITIAMLVAGAVAAPAAHASSQQLLVMQDDAQVRSAPGTTLDEFADLGADVVKLNLYWDEVAPKGRHKPSGFNGADPASYAWGSYDTAVAAILAHGMQPYLSLGGHAPAWATHGRGRPRHHAPEREGVPPVRPGRRAALPRRPHLVDLE